MLKSYSEIWDINIPADYGVLEESTDCTSSDWSADDLRTDVDIPAISKWLKQELETDSNRYAKSSENKPVLESVPVVQAVTAVERSPSDVRRKASTCCDKTTVDKSPAVTERSALGGPGGKPKSDGEKSSPAVGAYDG
jgi:hypothetical protein